MKYAACSFNGLEGSKTYDYGLTITAKIGDKVKVPAGRGEGWQAVTVMDIRDKTDVPAQYIKNVIEVITEEESE